MSKTYKNGTKVTTVESLFEDKADFKYTAVEGIKSLQSIFIVLLKSLPESVQDEFMAQYGYTPGTAKVHKKVEADDAE
jgi:hypothetical protein